jgi:hypothetical protein
MNLAFHCATLIDLRGGTQRLGGYHETTDDGPIQQSIKCSILVAWVKEGQPCSVAARPSVACKPFTPSRSRRSSVWPDPEQARNRKVCLPTLPWQGRMSLSTMSPCGESSLFNAWTTSQETASDIRSTSSSSSRHPCTSTGPVKTGGPEMASSKLQRLATWNLAKYRRQIGRDILFAV